MLTDDVSAWVVKQLRLIGATLKLSECGVGISYSYAVVEGPEGEFCGVALTPLDDLAGARIEAARRPAGVEDALTFLASLNPLEKSLGLALVNAASSYLMWGLGYAPGIRVEDAGDLLKAVPELVKGRAVLVVGNMGPLVRALKASGVNEVYVVERCAGLRCGRALSDTAFFRLVGRVESIIATGATLVNDTIEYILRFKRRGTTLVLVGPTAGAHPTPLIASGVNAVASMRVDRVSETVDIVRRGGGRWAFTRYCSQYVALPLKSAQASSR